MQKKTKTNNNNRTAPIEEAQNTKTSLSLPKKTTTCSSKKIEAANSSCSWMKSNTARPKTLFVQMQRTAKGYSIKEATVLSPVNQHASRQVPVNVRAVTEDINRRGIII